MCCSVFTLPCMTALPLLYCCTADDDDLVPTPTPVLMLTVHDTEQELFARQYCSTDSMVISTACHHHSIIISAAVHRRGRDCAGRAWAHNWYTNNTYIRWTLRASRMRAQQSAHRAACVHGARAVQCGRLPHTTYIYVCATRAPQVYMCCASSPTLLWPCPYPMPAADVLY